jgi:poly(ADP-ribose) glycohydrolase ARH3
VSRGGRARGVLLGLALGDALGAPFEGRTRVARVEVEAWREAPAPLRWTDDTHMALTLARHLADDPRLTDAEGLGRAFARAYAAEPWRGYGAGPPRVFAMVEQGWTFEAAAASLFDGAGSFGNGAAMRVAPVGLLPAATDRSEAAQLAEVQARVTHTHPDAVDGATVVAQVVAALLDADDVDAEVVAEAVADVSARLADGPVRAGLAGVLEVARAGGDASVATRRRGTGVAAAASVPAAVAALLGGDDLLEVVTTATSLGGDTDTVAAMAGAMAGAAWGLTGVPVALLERLEARDELERLAGALIEV